MNVLFVPNWCEFNPYQKLIKEALELSDIKTVLGDYQKGAFGLTKLSRKYRDCRVIHLHWIDQYLKWFFISDNTFKRWIKLFVYALDLLLVKATGRKIVWTVHNKFSHETKSILWEKRLRKLIYFMSDRVFVHSPSAIDEIKEHWNLKKTDKILVVPHGHYINCYKNVIVRNDARQKLNIQNDQKVFLYFGNIRPYKGVIELIKEFKEQDELKNAKLILVGKPKEEQDGENIKSLINGEQNIDLEMKFVQDDDIQLYMNAADIVVCPFKDILSSGSVILAMSFEKPIIAPRIGCLVDILDDQGALFFDDNELNLSKTLIKALSVDCTQMGIYNKNHVRQYSWENIGSQLNDAYREA